MDRRKHWNLHWIISYVFNSVSYKLAIQSFVVSWSRWINTILYWIYSYSICKCTIARNKRLFANIMSLLTVITQKLQRNRCCFVCLLYLLNMCNFLIIFMQLPSEPIRYRISTGYRKRTEFRNCKLCLAKCLSTRSQQYTNRGFVSHFTRTHPVNNISRIITPKLTFSR